MKNNFFKSDSRFLLLSIFTVSVFPYNYPLTEVSSITQNSLWIFLIVPIYYFYKFSFSGVSRKKLKYCGSLALLFSLILKVGRELILYSRLFYSISSILKNLIVVLGISILICSVLIFLLNLSTFDKMKNSTNKVYGFRFFFFLFLIVWMPMLFIFWPGIFSYDVPMQMSELVNNDISTHHPIVHTLLINIVIVIGKIFGNYNLGGLIYTLIQMLICIGINAYICSRLSHYKLNRNFYYLLVGYYLFFPLNMIFSIVATKDVLFSTFFFLLIFKLCEYYIFEKNLLSRNKAIELILIIVLVGLFRNNAIYALLGTLPFILFTKKRKKRNNLLFVFILGIFFTFVSNQAFVAITSARPGMQGQMYSVPLQQLARSYINNPDSFSKKEKEELFSYVPEVNLRNYNPRISDYVKGSFTLKHKGNTSIKFLKLWARIGRKNKSNYLDAFLMLTQGYWDPNLQFPDKFYKQPIVELKTYNTVLSKGFYEDSKLPSIREKIIDSFYTENSYKKIPLFSLLFSSGFVIWILLVTCLYSIYNGLRDFYFIFVFLILYYGTLLLGPVTLVRYVYPYMLVWPTLTVFVIIKANERNIISLTK